MSRPPQRQADAPARPLQGWRLGLQWVVTLVLVGIGVASAWGCLLTWRSEYMLNTAQGHPVVDDPALAEADLRLALRARPDLADGWRLLASSESFANPAEARRDAVRAVQRDQENWQTWQTLALIDYQLDDLDRARMEFDRAVRAANGFAAHFELGNFYRLLGDQTGFWREMTAALTMAPTANIEGNLDQILSADTSPGQRAFLACLPPDRPDVVAVAVNILYRRHWYASALTAWQKLRCRATGSDVLALAPAFDADWAPSCAGLTYGYVNALYDSAFRASAEASAPIGHSRLGAAQPRPGAPADGETMSATAAERSPGELVEMALHVWNRAARNGWVPFPPMRTAVVSDGNFQLPFQGPALGWMAGLGPGMDAEPGWLDDAASSLRIRLDGQQPDYQLFARQFVAVSAGSRYRLSFQSRALSPLSESGVELQIRGAAGDLASVQARLLPVWTNNELSFTAGSRDVLVAVEFAYDRPSGHVRLRGDIALRHVQLFPALASSQP